MVQSATAQVTITALGLGMLVRDALDGSSSAGRLVSQSGSLQQLWCIKPRLTGKGDTSFYQSEKLRLLRAPNTSMPGSLPDLCHGQ